MSSLGYMDSAVEDLLAALQCKVEPRHSIIDISLSNVQVFFIKPLLSSTFKHMLLQHLAMY